MSLIGKKKGRPVTRRQFDAILKNFLVFLKRELRMNQDIPFTLICDVDFSKNYKAFGMMTSQMIWVSIVNRHPIDVLRTFAHEYVHHKQRIQGKKLEGHPGSPIENEANAKAGELIRKYGKLHPELFDLMAIK